MTDMAIEAASDAKSDAEWDQEWRERFMELAATILVFCWGNRDLANAFVDEMLAPTIHAMIETAEVTKHTKQ